MIIGLTGLAFAGKDTVGAYLARAHNFSLVAFADPIRDALMAAFSLDPLVFRPELKEIVIDRLGKSPRQLMQLFGTEFGRQMIKPTIWTEMMERRIRHSIQAGDCDIVITDVRFWTEAALIARLGGQIWRINRPAADTTAHTGHVSETEMAAIPAHATLTNDGTLEQLYEQIDAAMFPKVEVAEPC